MTTTLRAIEEWTGHKQPRGSFPWLRVLLAAIAAVVIAATLTGCASTFYPDGRPKTITGDFTYQKSAGGSVSITLKHSPTIRAAGTASTQALAAAGAAATSIFLATP